ncbi:FadR/GntR family transcriptional regulator [Jiangella sp. DSM 45060]|uniref:FadR/GntR family transcriptional regulator n=1 Tax=Jiangella sp. DSM 45060 TaxID=1798224 RepID=UPI00087CA2DF|nr:FCD domain-containing protein [Jiangella sp. DSM 45060]SDT67894.1 DNA-binding transcriptional regulator, FadR family [Jiangella sp. DSM 45060]
MSVFRGIHGAVVAHLGELIVRGDVAPGAVLDPVRLENELGVSRTVVREALRVLAAKGMVDARPKRGTLVRPREEWALLDADVLRWQAQNGADDAFLSDLAEVREIVEPAGARLAARRRTDADLAALGDALTRMTDPDAVVEADLAFHRALLAAAHNALLRQLEEVIATGLRARDLLVHGDGSRDDSVPAHRAVLDAVTRGDADGAESAVRELLARADRDVRAITSGKEPE